MPSWCFYNFKDFFFFNRHCLPILHLPPVTGEGEIMAFEIQIRDFKTDNTRSCVQPAGRSSTQYCV